MAVVPLMVAAPGSVLADTAADGEWRGIRYCYAGGSVVGPAGFLRRRWCEVRGLQYLLRMIRDAVRSNGLDAVILYGPELRWIVPLRMICTRYRVLLVHDRSEYPFVYDPPGGVLRRAYRAWYMSSVFRLFDGVVVISKLLERTLAPRMRCGSWLLRVPIMVDADQFTSAEPPTRGLIGYAGNVGHMDEIEDLVLAVASLVDEVPDVHLLVIGTGSHRQVTELRAMIERHGMTERVDLKVAVPADEMPALLCSAEALALPRRVGLFSEAGMPTKLGEYLATGRPVVVTRTGDISEYLTDGLDAYLVEAADVAEFAAALRLALTESASAAVGVRGREVAFREFDPAAQMRRLIQRVCAAESGNAHE